MILPAAALAVWLATMAPSDLPPRDFVHLAGIVPDILQDMRYFTAHNFTGAPVEAYLAPACILTRQAADALAHVAAAVEPAGYRLMVWECYRPARAVASFVQWALGPDETMKAEFYPRVPKSELFQRGYIASRSRHSAGSTVDVTLVPKDLTAPPVFAEGAPLVDCIAPYGTRFVDGGIDMGTGYDCFDARAHGDAAGISDTAKTNRKLLTDAMSAAGFEPYAEEWWHFSLKDDPHKGEVFDFPVE